MKHTVSQEAALKQDGVIENCTKEDLLNMTKTKKVINRNPHFFKLKLGSVVLQKE